MITICLKLDNIEYVSSTYEQGSNSGDVTLHVTYSNTGDTTLTRTLLILITEPSGIVYSNSMKITMAAGETTTFDITVAYAFRNRSNE